MRPVLAILLGFRYLCIHVVILNLCDNKWHVKMGILPLVLCCAPNCIRVLLWQRMGAGVVFPRLPSMGKTRIEGRNHICHTNNVRSGTK